MLNFRDGYMYGYDNEEIRESNVTNTKGDLEIFMEAILSQRYPTLHAKIENTYPTGFFNVVTNPPLSIDKLIETLKQIKFSVIMTLATSEFGRFSIQDGILETSFMSNYDVVAEKVTYGVVSSISSQLMQHCLYYIDKSYVFNFIRDMVVMPDIEADINKVRDVFSTKQTVSKMFEVEGEYYELFNEFVKEVLIGMNYDRASNIGREIERRKVSKDMCKRALDNMVLPVPKFMYKYFVGDESEKESATTEMIDFLRKYIKTFKLDTLEILMRGYCDVRHLETFKDKIKSLYDDRISHLGLYLESIADGFTHEELRVANKIVKLQKLNPEEQSTLEQSELLRNIRKIIEKYKESDMKAVLVDNKIIIKSKFFGEKEVIYTSKDIMEDLDNPFNMFEEDREKVRYSWIHDRNKSYFTTTAITEDELSDIKFGDKYTDKPLTKWENRIAHRNKLISTLLKRYNPDTDGYRIEDVLDLINNPRKPIYSDYESTSSFLIIDEENWDRVLLKLAEIEGIYRKVIEFEKRDLEKRNVNKETLETKINQTVKTPHEEFEEILSRYPMDQATLINERIKFANAIQEDDKFIPAINKRSRDKNQMTKEEVKEFMSKATPEEKKEFFERAKQKAFETQRLVNLHKSPNSNISLRNALKLVKEKKIPFFLAERILKENGGN